MKTIKQSRAFSFLAVALVYILSTAVGVLLYRTSSYPWWLSLLFADVAATLATFFFSILFDNASVYDPYWSVQPPVILLAFALGRSLTLFGVLLLAAVFFWGIRLTANWAYTFGGLMHEDWRYRMLAERTGVFYPLVNFFGIHLVPTLVVYGCVLPAVYAIREGLPLVGWSVPFLLLSFLAVILQGVSDIQMHAYRKNRTSPFIRRGLWRYSRHPNYLGEILMWWGIALAILVAAPTAPYLVVGAVCNTALFLLVSIPMADGRQAKKEGFLTYKAQTRALLPLPRLAVRGGDEESFRDE